MVYLMHKTENTVFKINMTLMTMIMSLEILLNVLNCQKILIKVTKSLTHLHVCVLQ